MAHNILHLVEVEHQVQLTNIVEIVVQDLHEQVDALLQASVNGTWGALRCNLLRTSRDSKTLSLYQHKSSIGDSAAHQPNQRHHCEMSKSGWKLLLLLTRYASSLSVTSMHMAKNRPAYRRYTTLFALNYGSRKAALMVAPPLLTAKASPQSCR